MTTIPENLKYTKDHEWVLLEGTTATIGITDFAQSELGDVVFVDLPKAGKQLKQKDVLCVVESTKAASDVYAPISGTVREANAVLGGAPETLNRDPYTAGWLAKIDGVSAAEVAVLMDATQYRALVGE